MNENELRNLKTSDFNLLPMQSKQLVISEIINTLPDFNEDKFFIDLNDFLIYLLQYDQNGSCNHLTLSSISSSDFLACKNHNFMIQLHRDLM